MMPLLKSALFVHTRLPRDQMFTVLLATYNGERTVSRTLEAFCCLDVLEGEAWKLIIVDNGSTDATCQIIQSFKGRLPLSLVSFPYRGKNRALNYALPLVEGDFVVFTDDDVIPNRDWLVEIRRASLRYPSLDVFGGGIEPCWEISPPTWLLDAVPLGVTYGLTDPDLPEGPVDPGLVWGANMTVRRRIFEDGYRFNESVGPSEGQYIMGSETEFTRRVSAAGFRCGFVPSAVVRHIIRPNQLDPTWITARAFRFGRNICFQDTAALKGVHPNNWFGGKANFPRWMLRKCLQCSVMAYCAKLTGNRMRSLTLSWDASFYRGYIVHAQAMRRVTRHG